MSATLKHTYLFLGQYVAMEEVYTLSSMIAASREAGFIGPPESREGEFAIQAWRRLLEKARPRPDFWVMDGDRKLVAYYGATIRMVYEETRKEFSGDYEKCRSFLKAYKKNDPPEISFAEFRDMPRSLQAWKDLKVMVPMGGFNGIPFRRGRSGMLLAAVGFSLLIVATGPFVVEGFRVLDQAGPGEAVNHLESAAFRQELNPKQKFQLAWSYYIQGNMEGARDLANALINERYLDQATYGDTFYLLGQLARRRGVYPLALEYLNMAESSYQTKGKRCDVVVAKARVYTKGKDYPKAIHLLESALLLTQNPRKKGDIHLFLSDVYFWMGDWELSYHSNQLARIQYHLKKDKNGLHNVAMNHAWLLALSNRPDLVPSILKDLELALFLTGDEDRLYYLETVKLLLEKRTDGEMNPLRFSRLQKRAEKDQDLTNYLDFIQNDDGIRILEIDKGLWHETIDQDSREEAEWEASIYHQNQVRDPSNAEDNPGTSEKINPALPLPGTEKNQDPVLRHGPDPSRNESDSP